MDEFDTQMEKDDQKIQEFRNVLREIKKAVHEKYLYRSQNTNELHLLKHPIILRKIILKSKLNALKWLPKLHRRKWIIM